MYLRPHFGGGFEKQGSANRPTMNRFENLSTFSFTKSELKGVLFYEKIANSCIWGPTVRAVLDKWGYRPIGPNLTNFDF
jgi:hypothetical protein